MAKTVKMKPCPLCGNEHVSVTKVGGPPRHAYNISCGDDYVDFGCGLILFGGFKVPRKVMVAKWNMRIGEAEGQA